MLIIRRKPREKVFVIIPSGDALEISISRRMSDDGSFEIGFEGDRDTFRIAREEHIRRDDAKILGEFADRLFMDRKISPVHPCIKGTWITVNSVIGGIKSGLSWSDVLRCFPEITEDDIRTCLRYEVEKGANEEEKP